MVLTTCPVAPVGEVGGESKMIGLHTPTGAVVRSASWSGMFRPCLFRLLFHHLPVEFQPNSLDGIERTKREPVPNADKGWDRVSF